MPAEPEPPAVEALLRDAARRRREAFDAAGPGPATMPGPTRARLHEELARRFDAPAPARGGTARWWLAFAGAAGAAAVVTMFVVAHPKATPERAATVAVSSAPAAPPAPAPALPKPADTPAPEGEIAPGRVAARRDPPDADAAGAAGTLSKVKDAPPAPVNAPTGSLAGVLRAQTFTQTPLPLAAVASKSTAFSQRAAAPAPAYAPAAPARGTATSLLGNFRFEQQGENVRVVDADGSVYVGQVEADKARAPQVQAASRAHQTPSAADAVAPSQEASAGAENFRFRAAGDNRTLRKPVVFEGEYTAPPPLPPEVANNGNGAKLESKAANAKSSPTNPEAQIRGRVRVLDGREGQRATEVDARAVETTK